MNLLELTKELQEKRNEYAQALTTVKLRATQQTHNVKKLRRDIASLLTKLSQLEKAAR